MINLVIAISGFFQLRFWKDMIPLQLVRVFVQRDAAVRHVQCQIEMSPK